MRTLVIIPTYDEAASIETALTRTLAAVPDVEVLVVDDGSPDRTGDLVEARAQDDPRVHLLRRPGKGGLGAAYRAGFAWGLDRDFDVLVEMDADLSHPPERIPALLDALRTADVSIGSRYVPGAATHGWPWHRRAVSRLGNVYVSVALRLGVHDATAGFRAYRRQVLLQTRALSTESNGYCFQIEMTDRSRRAGYRVAEVPITFTERATGRSKMSAGIVAEALALVTLWGLRQRLHRRGAHSHHRKPDSSVNAVRDPSSLQAANGSYSLRTASDPSSLPAASDPSSLRAA